MESKFNVRNPAVKRIMQEMKEMTSDTSCDFIAEALEGDIFEWHFVIRGPPDTEFEGGVYHGRILLPPEYPFKPPSFMMLTPSGRFETNVKICLSISSHHPEHWQPSWSVRTALTALIAFMPSPGNGALGSLDFTKDERKVMALKARREPPSFGSAERQRVIEDMHGRMLERMAAAAAEKPSTSTVQEAASSAAAEHSKPEATSTGAASTNTQSAGSSAAGTEKGGLVGGSAAPSTTISATAGLADGSGTASHTAACSTSPPPQQQQQQQQQQAVASPAVQHQAASAARLVAQPQSADHGLTFLAIALAIGIAAILLRKVLAALHLGAGAGL